MNLSEKNMMEHFEADELIGNNVYLLIIYLVIIKLKGR